ncbi:MAG: hypothetical protein WDZ77_03100 [Candidatus Pacearchaeota archaeon]
MTYEPWTQKEIDEYGEIANQNLVGHYRELGLSKKNPEMIAKHLMENIIGDLSMTDEEVFRGKTKHEGRPVALRFLEDLADAKFEFRT